MSISSVAAVERTDPLVTFLLGLGAGCAVGLILFVFIVVLALPGGASREDVREAAGIAGVATIVVVPLMIITGFYTRSQALADRDRRAVVASYLDAQVLGDLNAAYQKLCSEAREKEPLQAFLERQTASGKRLLTYRIEGQRTKAQGMGVLAAPVAQSYYLTPSNDGDGVVAELEFTDGTSGRGTYRASRSCLREG